jgi:hypothetical protein
MYAIVEFVLLLLVLPFFLFGVVLRKIGKTITDNFEPIQLLSSIWFSIIGYCLLPFREVDESRPYISLVEVIAQSHIVGMSTPIFLFSMAGVLFITSVIVAKRRAN